jgi:hypothetical protein
VHCGCARLPVGVDGCTEGNVIHPMYTRAHGPRRPLWHCCAGDLIDEIYYTVGGSRAGEGAVLARSRNGTADLWRLNVSEPDGWYRLETNYDRLNPVGAARKLNCRPLRIVPGPTHF